MSDKVGNTFKHSRGRLGQVSGLSGTVRQPVKKKKTIVSHFSEFLVVKSLEFSMRFPVQLHVDIVTSARYVINRYLYLIL